uniref:Uncharacterized protein n=1 Tax=Leersia perrieri TaxID=77586 RepID=A0A0D9XQG0_9ORYZ
MPLRRRLGGGGGAGTAWAALAGVPASAGMEYCITQASNPPGNIGYMLSARALWLGNRTEWSWNPTPGGAGIARFPERAAYQGATPLSISGEIETKHLMLRTSYSVFLVYALAGNHSGLDGEHRSVIQSVPFPHVNFQASPERGVRLVVGALAPDGGAAEPDVMSYPVERGDGTMEVELGWFHVSPDAGHGQGRPHAVIAQLTITSAGGDPVRGLIVEGMEFRPMNFVDPI